MANTVFYQKVVLIFVYKRNDIYINEYVQLQKRFSER